MASPISTTPHDVMHSTLRILSDAGCTDEHAAWLRRMKDGKPANAAAVVQFIDDQIRLEAEALVKNPFEMTVEEQIASLRAAYAETFVPLGIPMISEEEIITLIATAPAWPKGPDCYRVFDLCWGEGRDGVIQTFEAHAARFKRVHAKNWRWNLLLSGNHPYKGKDVDRLRLLVGNETHKPCVSWTIVDLSANRQRRSITDVRGPNSLAQVGIILGWLFPKRVEAIDYKEWYAWFCAGYESNVPEYDESWQRVPCVNRGLGDGTSSLSASNRGNDSSGYAVPVSQGVQR